MAIRDIVTGPSISLNEGPFLVIGLGNIGDRYKDTRHNIGFMALDKLAHKFELGSFKQKKDLNADILETTIAGEKVVLTKPTTYMNKSGLAVVKIQNYFSVNDDRIVVVYDDIDIDFGTIRQRIGGSSGGHNGIKSIEQVIGDLFARIRIGVKNATLEHQDAADFVLSRFSSSEKQKLDELLDEATNGIFDFIEHKFEETTKTL